MGSGILPATIYNNKLYFLFGKERRGLNSIGYSDFGGSKENDESYLKTAIREGSEELCGFLGSDKDIEKILKLNGTYNIDYNNRYRCHIFPIIYDPKLVVYFNNNHKFIKKYLSSEIIIHSKIYEKEKIEWICIDDLIKFKKKFRNHFQFITQSIFNQKEEINKFIRKGLGLSVKK